LIQSEDEKLQSGYALIQSEDEKLLCIHAFVLCIYEMLLKGITDCTNNNTKCITLKHWFSIVEKNRLLCIIA
jgi:hypothetical protein